MFLVFPEHFTRDTRDYKVQVWILKNSKNLEG